MIYTEPQLYNVTIDSYKTISRVEYFEAAHLLPNHNGLCKNLHGHSYMCKVTVKSDDTQEFGMIMDYALLKQAMKAVLPDHMYLHFEGNEISEEIVKILDEYGLAYKTFPFATSVENIAPVLRQEIEEYIHNELNLKNVYVVEIEIHETKNSECICHYEEHIKPAVSLT